MNKTMVCVSEEIIADEETPVSIFRRMKQGERYCFLLESVEQGEQIGRYSFIGSDPVEAIIFTPGNAEIVSNGDKRIEEISGGPVTFLREYMKQRVSAGVNGIPFTGGAVGYLGYDIVQYIEDIPDPCGKEREFPEGVMLIADKLVVFDHVRKSITIIANSMIKDNNKEHAEKSALQKIEEIKNKLSRQPEKSIKFDTEAQDIDFQSNTSREEFMESVRTAKHYIEEGDIFQTVLSQRISCPVKTDPFSIYRNLRIMNPSPYMFYFELDGLYLVGSSPEVLVRSENDSVNVRPIAGTRKRGDTPEQDRQLAEELVSDEKERAEHLMLIDLGRNDVGRVAEYGTVEVDEQFIIERYSHVMHLVSNVTGQKREEFDMFDVFEACFPAGTLSGAPKVRAMEIISELEPDFRGPYGGAVGYFSFNRSMDTCITIRTITINNDVAYIQSGAGIVADSDPATEFDETLRKARALMKSIQITV